MQCHDKDKMPSLWNLISKYTVETNNLLKLYQQNVDSKIITVPKIMRWKEKRKKQVIATLLKNAIDTLEACNADLFPNVQQVLAILATLPVTTVTCERNYSTMRYQKTYLKFLMGEQPVLLWGQYTGNNQLKKTVF